MLFSSLFSLIFCSLLCYYPPSVPKPSSSLRDLSPFSTRKNSVSLSSFSLLNLNFDSMPFAYLLKTKEIVASFKASFDIPQDVEGAIKDQRHPHVVFFPLMSILKGKVRFPVDPLLLRTLSFYVLSPGQCLPNFYKVVHCVRHLNHLYSLSLTHHDINFVYSIRGSLDLRSYLQTRSIMFRLISYLPNFNRNSTWEFVKVSSNWLNRELTCPTSPRQIGQYFLLPTPTLCVTCSLPPLPR